MSPNTAMMLPWFGAASSLVFLVYLVASSRKGRVERRLDDLSGKGGDPWGQYRNVTVVDDPLDPLVSRRKRQEARKKRMQDRLALAGFYNPRAAVVFVVLRGGLLLLPVAGGFAAGRMGLVSPWVGIVLGVIAGVTGTLAPSFWLDHLKRARQTQIRRALPDALDVLVVCLQGGVSLAGSFARVARELANAHPMLAVEFQIVQRQTQMGRSTGQAMREFANRFDLEELRSMASVIVQAERIGASVVTALTVFADTLRVKRFQRAEEMAQKTTVKLLFPLILFIMPCIFVVVAGPAILGLIRVFG
ncbi:MAG: type II secretion system F family protein [Candidatus Hinthialibacter sp.]